MISADEFWNGLQPAFCAPPAAATLLRKKRKRCLQITIFYQWLKSGGWFAETVIDFASVMSQSAVQEYLGPALAPTAPHASQGQNQNAGSNPGRANHRLAARCEIDLALTGEGADLLSRDFYTHKLATVRSLVVLPLDHPLAAQTQVSISELKMNPSSALLMVSRPDTTKRSFSFAAGWVNSSLDSFRFGPATSLAEGLVLAANEGAISLNPAFISHLAFRMLSWFQLPMRQLHGNLFVSCGSEVKLPGHCELYWTGCFPKQARVRAETS